jgi:hypothetical protein
LRKKLSRLTDLIAQAKAKDSQFGADLEREVKALSSRLPFGLNFERHSPEAVELPLRPIRKGDKVRVVERALQAEMTDHLGHGKNQVVANEAGNTRNGRSKKTLKGDFGELPIEIPRDRAGTFEPQIITKHQTRWSGFDDKILSLYARGMTVREIQSHLQEMYGAEVSPTLISSVTDAVLDEQTQGVESGQRSGCFDRLRIPVSLCHPFQRKPHHLFQLKPGHRSSAK